MTTVTNTNAVIRIINSADASGMNALVERASQRDSRIERRVRRIIVDVRQRGDAAVLAYARRLDRLDGPVEVDRSEVRKVARAAARELRAAIAFAAANIRAVARRQMPRPWRAVTTPGVRIEQRVTPLERVGCYVPSGRYPLPSSLLMTAIPARVAGVGEIVVACARPDAAIMAAAVEAGVDRLFRIGGAHAVAALAYGTESIRRVDKIVGPGNAYVAAAKAQVAADCAIDFFAGPTEIVIVSTRGRPDWIAADLIAQAEHDPDARAILLTPSRRLATDVARFCTEQVTDDGPARKSLARHGAIVVTRSLTEAIALSQRIAPEHAVCDDDVVARRLTRAGTVLVGSWGAQALGDYVTGSNHVLPTGGAARARGGLSAADFVRIDSVQRIDRRGISRTGPSAITLARAEGLNGHARSIAIRLRARTA